MDAQTPAQRLDTLSVISLVLAIGAFMTVWCCIGYPIGMVAVVLGAVALSRNQSGGYSATSRVLSFSGIGITAFAIFLHVILIAAGQVSKPELPGSEKAASSTPSAAPSAAVADPVPEPVAPAPEPAPVPEPVAVLEPAAPIVDPLPPAQRAFCDAVKAGADSYKSAEAEGANELKLSKLRSVRKAALAAAVSRGAFKEWIGSIDRIATSSGGQASLKIKLRCEARVKIGTSMFDGIEQSNPLFDFIADQGEGANVKVSGKFVAGGTDGYSEGSLTERGSMTDPDFTVEFSAIAGPL